MPSEGAGQSIDVKERYGRNADQWGGRILPEVEADEQDKGLRRLYDWVEQDAGKTVLMSGIQTVGAKSWE